MLLFKLIRSFYVVFLVCARGPRWSFEKLYILAKEHGKTHEERNLIERIQLRNVGFKENICSVSLFVLRLCIGKKFQECEMEAQRETAEFFFSTVEVCFEQFGSPFIWKRYIISRSCVIHTYCV